jgi:hypothetical protein
MLLSRHTIVKNFICIKDKRCEKVTQCAKFGGKKKKLLVYIAAESAHGSENSNTVIE